MNAVSATEAALAVPDAEVTEEVVVLLGARAQGQARELADSGRLGEASAKLREAADNLRKAAQGSSREAELEEHAARLEGRSLEFEEGQYDLTSRKLMTFESRTMKQRRYRPPEK